MMKNNKANIIDVIGWINIIGGGIVSFIFGKAFPIISLSNGDTAYNWPLVIAGIVISIVSGVMFLGFAEIIHLLQERVDQSVIIEKLLVEFNKNRRSDSDKAIINKIPVQINVPSEKDKQDTTSKKDMDTDRSDVSNRPIPGTKKCANCGAICNVDFKKCDMCDSDRFI